MNRTQIIDVVAAETDASKAVARRILAAFEARVKAHNDAGHNVTLRGFGAFSQGIPSPKAGRNPKTGAAITYTVYHRPTNVPNVTYTALLDEIAADTKAALPTIARALDGAIGCIVSSVSKGYRVNLNGFGCFQSSKRAARTGRNPKTGASILIPATTVPHFKASKAGNIGAKFAAGTGFKSAVAGRRI